MQWLDGLADTGMAPCFKAHIKDSLPRGSVSAEALQMNREGYYAHDEGTEADGFLVALESWCEEPMRRASQTRSCC